MNADLVDDKNLKMQIKILRKTKKGGAPKDQEIENVDRVTPQPRKTSFYKTLENLVTIEESQTDQVEGR